ncbi:MAG: multiheme c-type cytochrome [Planctomycetaceae bacterium]
MLGSRSSSAILLAVIVVGVLLRPLSSSNLWLALSHGAAVLDGSFCPSRMLLVNEAEADADWLGGVPFVVAYSLFDAHGLMLLKFVGGILTAVVGWKLAREAHSVGTSLFLGLGFLASLASWDVGAQFWDVLGIVAFCWCLREQDSKLWPGLLVLGIWSQLGCLAVVGLAAWSVSWCFRVWLREDGSLVDAHVLASVATAKKVPLFVLLLQILLAVVVCSLNPRGVFSLWDSLRLAIPRLASDGVTLLETEWRPLLTGPWDVSHFAFAVLTCLALCGLRFFSGEPEGVSPRTVAIVRGSVRFELICVAMAIGLGWMCRAHVGFAGIWLSLLLVGRTPPQLTRLRFGLVLIALVILAWWPWEGRRPGWGLDSRLDERLLAQALSDLSAEGTVWADDELSAGMCLWVTNQRRKVHDTPHRALLGGRLREFVSLRRDLEQGRLAAYQREDHSAGGWWLPLRERGTVLLMVTAQRGQLLRALEPTLWKPLTLDSPVLPFGQSGMAEVSPQILDVLRQRDLVENEAWSSSLSGPAGTDRLWDVWGFCGVSPNVEQELRQAQVFRAMQLPLAGLRVLEPALRISQSRALQLAAADCRRDLAFDPVAQARSSAVSLSVAPPEIDRCVACHTEQTSEFTTTGHHNALKTLGHTLTRELLGPDSPSHPVEVSGVRLWSAADSGQFVSSSQWSGESVPSQWLFGSGKHARTPVSVWLNADGAAEALEHRLSWYPQHGWDGTLGLSGTKESSWKATGFPGKDRRAALESLGKIHDPAATRDCFGCHTTQSPLTGDAHRILGKPLVMGVSCERCHPGGDRHAQISEHGATAMTPERWRSLTPLESVNRCGECHRRADHFTRDELHPDNQMLIRFASVGLVQSACFLKQATLSADQLPVGARPRFDCLTCHDPHRPAESDATFYAARCAACHDSAAKNCSQQPRDSNCLPCHMPKVEVQSPLRFTDHWIRVRKSP